MNKIRWNIGIFAAAALFLILGLCGNCFPNLLEVLREDHPGEERITDRIDNVVEESLPYHDMLLDLNSVKENLIGTRVVEKPDTLVVKADSGKLIGYIQAEPIDEIQQAAILGYVESVRGIAEHHGAKFLCCLSPLKNCYENPPSNVPDFSRQNYETLRTLLEMNEIPLLDLKSAFRERGLPDDTLYFDTDHHWTPETAFDAYAAICKELDRRYGFGSIAEYTDMNSFDVQKYGNWFLGAYGKKVGRFFTWKGADDFDLITPAFDTEFTEELPLEGTSREGSFRDTMLYPEYLEKNYYGTNTYQVYSGGDFRLQILRNRLLPKGPKVLILRSSFGCTVTPFLALQCSELHVIDDREGTYPRGECVDLESYISEVKPDYVIILKQLYG